MNYTFSKKESIMHILIACIVLIIIAYLFYGEIKVALILSPSIWIYMKYQKKIFIIKKKEELKLEFCNAIEALCAPLRAGYSLENSFKKIEMDMKLVYGSKSLILDEITCINNKVDMNVNIEDALNDFAKKSDIKEIKNFAEIIKVSKRTDGNIIKVINFTSRLIRNAYETKREITTLISEKKYEASIMKVVPLAMLLYMNICMHSYISVLYGNIFGIIVMSTLLIAYVCINVFINKLCKIDI